METENFDEPQDDFGLPYGLDGDFLSMRLCTNDLGITSDSNDLRSLIRAESAHILSQKYLSREMTKEKLQKQQNDRLMRLDRARNCRLNEWERKTARSPYALNLVAENERITEENESRHRLIDAQTRLASARLKKAKTEVLLKALVEHSELDALRREKKAILEEEVRLRALLSLEKSKPSDIRHQQIAKSAELERKKAAKEERRNNYTKVLNDFLEEEKQALSRKHGCPEKPDNTFGYISDFKI